MKTNFTSLHGTSRESAVFPFAHETNLSRAGYSSMSPACRGCVALKSVAGKLAIVFAVIACIFLGARTAGAKDTPTATIELSGGSVAAGIGYTWGNGTLIFEGKRYPIKIQGLTAVDVGASDYSASGKVYHLKKLSDLNGVYTAVSAGAALGGGASATTMENSHGVVIQMIANQAGIDLTLGPKGMVISR